ncbi:MAG: hypothetical protein IJN11_05190 [Oscillospiraceae bacterium]|nr:hypothetical protein [Ruminococcus sp.]MBQ7002445.1 hypothetical protein [Oscillospiraceae bacterium]MBQ7013293.1 hypothetical protein [Oscillospiraceae bacterium]
MKKRAAKFILALTTLSAIIWIIGELLIGEFINNWWVSVAWAVLVLVGCCTYSLIFCPRAPYSDKNDAHKED